MTVRLEGDARQVGERSMPDRRNVVTVTPWFPNRPGEREGNYVHDSAAAVAASGRNVSVLVSRPYRPFAGRSGFEAKESIPFDNPSFPGLRHVEFVRHLSVPRNLAPGISDRNLDAVLEPALNGLVRRLSAGIIHAHTESMAPAAISVARRTGAKVAVTLHGINVGKRFFDDSKRRERFRSALNAADRVILVGEPLREFFADLIGRTDHFRVVPNGFVLPSNVANPSVLERGRKLELISVSNLTEGKGIEVTIQALGQVWQRGLRAWTYTVVGDGPSKPQLRRLAQSLGIDTNVRFTGAVPHEHVYACLAAADVFVLPSYREAFGIAYLEAMAAGLLAIGVRGQGPGAFISDEVTGLLVAPRDPDDLGLRLTDILSDPTKFRGIAAEGSRKARSGYTWTRHAEVLTGVYDEMLAETP